MKRPIACLTLLFILSAAATADTNADIDSLKGANSMAMNYFLHPTSYSVEYYTAGPDLLSTEHATIRFWENVNGQLTQVASVTFTDDPNYNAESCGRLVSHPTNGKQLVMKFRTSQFSDVYRTIRSEAPITLYFSDSGTSTGCFIETGPESVGEGDADTSPQP